ncbi:MAG: Gfo/Idh/MocA family protein [Planctomycetota bacterium]
MSETIRWAIIGTGSIASKFATGLQELPDATLQAVGSRSQDRADEFGDEYDAPERFGSYRELAQSSSTDIIYIATPHPFHHDNTLLCLRAGKPVLCEKPFAVNAAQAEEMVQCARERDLFCMEGMWTRFFPLMDDVRSILANGDIGEPRMLQVDFGFRIGWEPESRLLNPDLAGGSLLDVGIYCCALSSMIFGDPTDLAGLAHIGETGVDEEAGWVLKHDDGQIAVCSSAVRTGTPMEAVINGTDGRITIHSPWWIPTSMTVEKGDSDPETLDFPLQGNGMNYEAAEVMNCLRNGKTEHEIMPLDETLRIAGTMDSLREEWGLEYPFE